MAPMSEDDPEQRIRDLERPLADPAAVTEEVIVPDRQGVGMRVGWIALGLLILGLVIGGGYLIAERMTVQNTPVAGRPTTEVITGGGGSFTAAPPAPGTATPPLPADGGAISVAGIDRDETHVCNDSIVSISGVHNHVVLTGHCARVDISGIRNTVIMDEADAIVISGMNNSARFHSGSPQISQSGMDNSLERG